MRKISSNAKNNPHRDFQETLQETRFVAETNGETGVGLIQKYFLVFILGRLMESLSLKNL